MTRDLGDILFYCWILLTFIIIYKFITILHDILYVIVLDSMNKYQLLFWIFYFIQELYMELYNS